MLDKLTVDELTTSSPAFANAMLAAGHLSTEELFAKLEQVKYEAFGFPAVQVWRMLSLGEEWECGLRNDTRWKEPKLECTGKTVKEALTKLYAWCVHRGYLPCC